MCNFFSCISNGKGKIWYFDASIRADIRAGKLKYEEDSHASIANYFRRDMRLTEDQVNKYEYDPMSGQFTVDDQYATDENGLKLDDRERVEALCRNLDFSSIVANWSYVQDILTRLKSYKHENPFTAEEMPEPSKIKAVMTSIRGQVWGQVGDQVWGQVWDQVWGQVWVCACYAVKMFMALGYDHPAFDLIRLGVIVINVFGKFKVFGKGGKFLGEIDAE